MEGVKSDDRRPEIAHVQCIDAIETLQTAEMGIKRDVQILLFRLTDAPAALLLHGGPELLDGLCRVNVGVDLGHHYLGPLVDRTATKLQVTNTKPGAQSVR